MTRTSKKLKIALIAIAIYAIIATVIIVCLTLTRKEKDTATPAATTAEAAKIGVGETDDYRKLPEEKQKEFIQKAKGPNAEKNCTEQEWLPKLKRGNTYLLLDNKHWGRTGGDQLFIGA